VNKSNARTPWACARRNSLHDGLKGTQTCDPYSSTEFVLMDESAQEGDASAVAIAILLPMTHGRRLRIVDIANYLGVSKQRAHQLTKDPSFPAPFIQTFGERMWRRSTIEAWARRRWWGTRPWRRRPA
jgi:predicted DNA-binding transcriptional regulator AlpA